MKNSVEKNLEILMGKSSGATETSAPAKEFKLPRVEVSMAKAYAEFYPVGVEKSFQYLLDNDSMSVTVTGKALKEALLSKKVEAESKLAMIKAEMAIHLSLAGEVPTQQQNSYEISDISYPNSPRFEYSRIREKAGVNEYDNWETCEAYIRESPEASAMERYNSLVYRCDDMSMELAVLGTAIRTLEDGGKYKLSIRQATKLGL